MHSERSEIINLKMNYFKDINNQQQKLFSIFLSSINPDVHVNKEKHFIKGVPQKQRFKKNGGFFFKMRFIYIYFFFFLLFGSAH